MFMIHLNPQKKLNRLRLHRFIVPCTSSGHTDQRHLGKHSRYRCAKVATVTARRVIHRGFSGCLSR